MITDNLINYLEPEDIVGLDTEDILDVRIANKIDLFCEDEAYMSEPGLARAMYRDIAVLLDKYRGILSGTESLKIFLNAQVKLGWFAFPSLDPKERTQLVGEKIVAAVNLKIDVKNYLDRYFDLFETRFLQEKESRASFLEALTHNREYLGQEALVLQTGERETNTLANWLRDYVSYSEPNFIQGGSYGLAQYLYSSPNVKKLSPEARESLAQILAVYNYLKTPKASEAERTLVKSSPPRPQVSNPPRASLDLLKSRLEKRTPVPAVQPIAPKPQAAGAVKMTPREIEREVETPELPAHLAPANLPPVPKPVMPLKPKPLAAKVETINFAPKAQAPSAQRPAPSAFPAAVPKPPVPVPPKPVAAINVVDDLKKLNLDYLRAGSLQSQISNLKSQISRLAEANNLLPYHVVLAYEESPLFKAYLSQGSNKLGGEAGQGGGLTQQEFEALADLRREIEHI